MNFYTRVGLVLAFLSLLTSSVTADPFLRLKAGATTSRAEELTSKPGFTLGGAVAITRWARFANVAVVPQLELLFAHRNTNVFADGAEHGSQTTDSLELPLLLRGELTAGSRIFYLMGGTYGSALLRAQTMDSDGIVEGVDASSRVDIGWLAAGGFSLASLAGGELSIEMRYQRGYQALLPGIDDGQKTFSLLLGYGLGSPGSGSLPSRNPDQSLALKGGLVATRFQPSESAASAYSPGFSLGGTYSPFRLGSRVALVPQLELSFVRRNAAEPGPADSSLTLDYIDLSMLVRGELAIFDRAFYGIGGVYGSLLVNAQRSHEGVVTNMRGAASSVDAGWIAGAGIELASIASIKPSLELRYQRGIHDLFPAGSGEVIQQSVSCLFSIAYGGGHSSSSTLESVPGVLYSGNEQDGGAKKSPSTKRITSVAIGREGDRWVSAMRFVRIERATHNGKRGYNISYNIAGHGSLVLFWPRDRIALDGRSPGYRLQSMKLRKGRLWYPTLITARSLPRVHRGILQIEQAYAKQADGAASAMQGFAVVAGLGGLKPTLRATGPSAEVGTSYRATARQSSKGAARPAPAGAAARDGVWKMGPLPRGQVIERALGSNLPSNFPVIDRFSGGVATSIKSLDLSAKSYQSAANLARTVRRYIDSVATFSGRTWGGVTVRGADISGRALELAVPAGAASAAQRAALEATIQYGQSVGVTVRLIAF